MVTDLFQGIEPCSKHGSSIFPLLNLHFEVNFRHFDKRDEGCASLSEEQNMVEIAHEHIILALAIHSSAAMSAVQIESKL